MSQTIGKEMLARMRQRYTERGSKGKTALITEVCEQWGYSRKHAIKLLNAKAGWGGNEHKNKGRPKRYGKEVKEVVWKLWKVAEQPCGKRLKAWRNFKNAYSNSHGQLGCGSAWLFGS